mmetsp:Transcript_10904/g.67361  ORF Transcript_10904/g.67361 Transcript_10904/m.67361 type:complete len:105 (-) Transcript_10904:2259-2573(-)
MSRDPKEACCSSLLTPRCTFDHTNVARRFFRQSAMNKILNKIVLMPCYNEAVQWSYAETKFLTSHSSALEHLLRFLGASLEHSSCWLSYSPSFCWPFHWYLIAF